MSSEVEQKCAGGALLASRLPLSGLDDSPSLGHLPCAFPPVHLPLDFPVANHDLVAALPPVSGVHLAPAAPDIGVDRDCPSLGCLSPDAVVSSAENTHAESVSQKPF